MSNPELKPIPTTDYRNADGDCILSCSPCTWEFDCSSCPETESEEKHSSCKFDGQCAECPEVSNCGL